MPTDLPTADAQLVLARARFDHITGFLASAVAAGAVRVKSDDLVRRIERQWHDELRICLALEQLTVRTAEVLQGVGWRLTKGPALAHLDYPEPSIRTFGDVDLIVHPEDWTTAVELLEDHGYRRAFAPMPHEYEIRWGKGVTLLSVNGFEVDLHRRLAVGRFGVVADMRSMFTGDASIRLAGRTIPVLSPDDRLLHACYHATLGGFRRLRAFRDVAQLILVTGADWDSSLRTARSWRSEAVVATAIKEAWHRLSLDRGHDAYQRSLGTPISRGDRVAIERFARQRGFRSQSLTALSRLPVHERPLYVWSLASSRWRRRS